MRVVVASATGRVGSRVCRLLDDAGVCWTGWTRRPDAAAAAAQAAGFVPQHGRWEAVDPEQADRVQPSLQGAAALLLATHDHPAQDAIEAALIRACVAASVGHVVKLSAQSAGLSPPVSFGRLHARAEQALHDSGLSWTVLRPVFFMQSLLYFAGPVRRGTLPAPTGRGRVAFVDVEDVAAAAAAALIDPATHAGRTYVLTGRESHAFADVAAGIAMRAGRAVRHRSPPGWLARLALPLATGMPRWQATLVVELMQAIARDAQAETWPDLRQVIGREARGLEIFLDAQAAAFR
ncbi:MAG: NAD(P)H-binding protein [Lautropia sp.]